MISTCAKATSHELDCLAGGIEGLIDLTLTPSRAMAFCRTAPAGVRAPCFERIGHRLSQIRAEPADALSDCALARQVELASACIRGSKGQVNRAVDARFTGSYQTPRSQPGLYPMINRLPAGSGTASRPTRSAFSSPIRRRFGEGGRGSNLLQ